MSNAVIARRVAGNASRKVSGHPTKNQTTPHPVSKKRLLELSYELAQTGALASKVSG